MTSLYYVVITCWKSFSIHSRLRNPPIKMVWKTKYIILRDSYQIQRTLYYIFHVCCWNALTTFKIWVSNNTKIKIMKIMTCVYLLIYTLLRTLLRSNTCVCTEQKPISITEQCRSFFSCHRNHPHSSASGFEISTAERKSLSVPTRCVHLRNPLQVENWPSSLRSQRGVLTRNLGSQIRGIQCFHDDGYFFFNRNPVIIPH